MTWLAMHMTQILMVWGLLWALASATQNVFPAGSTGYKIVHVVLAISPGDFGKALKIVGTSLVPPTMVLLLSLGLSSSACSSAPKTPPNYQAVAQAAVTASADAWNAAANGCLAVAGATDAGASNPALAHECEMVLQPIHDTIVQAQVAASVWDDVSQKNLPCLMANIGKGLASAASMFKLPTSVSDAALIAVQFGKSCPADGG